jgi:hypothetical protein
VVSIILSRTPCSSFFLNLNTNGPLGRLAVMVVPGNVFVIPITLQSRIRLRLEIMQEEQ